MADFEIDKDEAEDSGAAEDYDEDIEENSVLQAAGSQDVALGVPEDTQLPKPPEKLSGHERRVQRMANRAQMLEAQNLAEKEWFMRGEAAAGDFFFFLLQLAFARSTETDSIKACGSRSESTVTS